MHDHSQSIRPDKGGLFTRAGIVGFCGVVMLTLVACWIYVPTLRYEMIYDDKPAIVENESVHSLTPLFGEADGFGPLKPKLVTPLTARPLVNFTMAVNYHFSQIDPMGYRLTHLVLHIIAALLLWAVVASTLSQPVFGDRFVRTKHSLSFAAALLWMVHPTHTETVIYLTQRTELLMGLFYILTIYLAIQFWRSERMAARIFWSVLAMLASICGMLSKEMMASVPAMVLVYEWTFIGGSIGAMFKRSWTLHLGLALSWLPLIAIYQAGYNTPLGGFGNTIAATDFWLTQSNSFFVYWRLLFFPLPLMLHYHVPTLTTFVEAWPGVVGIVIYGFATLYFLSRRTATGFALLWFFATLSPTLIVPLPHEEIAERRMYLPLLAMIPYLSIGLFELIAKFRKPQVATQTDRDAEPSKLRSLVRGKLGYLPTYLAAIVLAVICVNTVHRLRSSQIIWLEVLKYNPDDTIAIAGQGAVELNRGEHESGLAKIEYAFNSDPGYEAFSLLYIHALKLMQLDERLVEVCRQLYEVNPDDPRNSHNLASALESSGQIDEAIERYREAIQLDPSRWEAHTALATLLSERYETADALKHFEIATQLHPDFMNCMNLMGMYIQTQQSDKVLQTARKLVMAARKEESPDVIERAERGLEALEKEYQERLAVP